MLNIYVIYIYMKFLYLISDIYPNLNIYIYTYINEKRKTYAKRTGTALPLDRGTFVVGWWWWEESPGGRRLNFRGRARETLSSDRT